MTLTGLKKQEQALGTEEKETHRAYRLQVDGQTQCELLDLPRSTAYYQNVQLRFPEEIAIKNAIDRIHFLNHHMGQGIPTKARIHQNR